MKRSLRHAILLLAFAAPAAAAECPAPIPLEREEISIEGSQGARRFTVEIADSDAARSAGLMCRQELAADHGMLFIYPRAQIVRMWMKNTYLPLDMIFIAADGRIVKIVPDVPPRQPGRINSDRRVKMVLELPAGAAAREGIRVGDTLRRPKPSPRATE